METDIGLACFKSVVPKRRELTLSGESGAYVGDIISSGIYPFTHVLIINIGKTVGPIRSHSLP
jgi:hypothetical protein